MSAPLVRDVSGAPPPERLLSTVAGDPWVLWLDTALPGGPWGRYSFLAVDPYRVLRGRGGRAEWVDDRGAIPAEHAPLVELRRELARTPATRRRGPVPFAGGAAGMFGYELGGDLEVVPAPPARDLPVPDLELGLYDLVVGWDRAEDRCWIVATGTGGEPGAAARLDRAERWLAGGPPPRDHGVSLETTLAPHVTQPHRHSRSLASRGCAPRSSRRATARPCVV